MTDFLEPIKNALKNFEFRDLVDIIIVAFILYMLIRLFTKTRAIRMVIGLGIILIFARIFDLLNLSAVSWLLSWVLQASAVLIVVLFQPEIRRALEKLGQGSFFTASREPAQNGERLIEEFSRAILNMAKHKVGAILVFERKTGLAEVLESGTRLDADVSSELIENIFYPNTPLHDGAMVVRDGRIIAAGCFLPLSRTSMCRPSWAPATARRWCVSEVSDAYVIVVAEERGTITFAYDGVLTRNIDAKALRGLLKELFMPEQGGPRKGKVDLSAETKEINISKIAQAGKKDGEEDGK